MKKTNKALTLVTALGAITVCSSVIAGSTFALFTSESNVDITVKAGQVELTATIDNLKVYSAVANDEGTLVDENGHTYEYVEQTGNRFINGGGDVKFEGNQLTVDGMVAGDRVTFDVNVTNSSTVKVKYRTKIATSGDELLKRALNFKIGEENLTNIGEYATGWTELEVPETEEVISYGAEIFLPITNTSNNGGKCVIEYSVEAVQANAVTEGEGYKKEFDTLYTVTPDTIDEYLSGEHGSISNATILLAPGDYGTIVLGSPSAFAESNTVYTCKDGNNHSKEELTFTSSEEFLAHYDGKWHGSSYYNRTIENLTLVGQKGVTVAGVSVSSGHVYGDSILDPVKGAVGNGSRYFMSHNMNNITFKNVSFTAQVNFATSSADTVIDGVTFEGCSFTTGGIAPANAAGLRYYNEINNGNVRNLTVNNCSFENCYQGVYTSSVVGVTVTDSTFKTTGHNAIAVQGKGGEDGAVNHKAVIITGNKFDSINDRIIRFNVIGADTQITIRNNTATNSGDDENDIMKATSVAEGVTCDIGGNNWGEGTKVSTPELCDR